MASAFFDASAAPKGRRTRNPHATDEPAGAPPRYRKPKRAQPKGLPRAALVQALGTSLWIPQAALLAWSVGAIVNRGGLAAVAPAAASILALGILRAGLDAMGMRMAFRAARTELTQRRERAAEALAARSPLDIDRPASGAAASLLAEQAETTVPYFARFLPARMKASFVPLAILVCVLPISWVAALILLLSAPLIPVFMALIGWSAKEASEKQLAETGGLNAFLLDRLRGLATIRALDAVDATALRLRADADSLRMRTMAVLKIAFLSSAVLELFSALGVAATAVYVGFGLLGSIDVGTWQGKLGLTQGMFILLLAPAFFEPLRELSAVWHDRAAGEAALDALDKLSAEAPILLGASGAEDAAAIPPVQSPPAIRIESLNFSRETNRRPIFNHFSLAVRPGEHVALLGASGSGKTTLLSLIAGLAAADSGTIQIDDTVLSDVTAHSLRHRMAWIGQRPHVFAGTLFGNITLGRPEITTDAVRQAIDHMYLGHIEESRGKALIGEGGIGLSGGEALRLALARAAANPRADIILADEPTAHLDGQMASEITESLLALAQGRTLIVATHDPVLAARMNRTIRLGMEMQEVAA
ncbi:thiol reductant ABC exporter subunit CydD [Neorhizobium sp. P12A]|uniref:thiol reductant ABC exporter subunit CydD n=1 Tax=Neorhizobium sp. P12A TaxID=2268027 RepID=UPI0011EEF30F|nr:thiol reductant ABC exporter subunit CydD [Neorhizobium sp. P12A]KAA0695709.1 thiol reductant ABC exporter subunit CydD [Neorhizobium sp. P12A]